jgi:hypothetical protein
MSPECSLPPFRFGLAYRHRGLGNPSAEDPRPEEARGPMVKVAKIALDASPSRNWRPNLTPHKANASASVKSSEKQTEGSQADGLNRIEPSHCVIRHPRLTLVA